MLGRLGVLLLLAVGASVLVAALTRSALAPVRSAWAASAPVAFDDLATAAAGLALAGCWLWVLLTGTPEALLAARALRAGRAPVSGRLPAPRPVRLLVLLVLGAPGLALSGVGTAVAGTVPPSPGAAPAARVAPPGALTPALLTGLPLPDRTTGVLHPTAGPDRPPRPREVLVRPGDSLWLIAARELAAPGADRDAVAVAAARLHAANADRLGDDPDLIFPGTHLVLPPAAPTREEHP